MEQVQAAIQQQAQQFAQALEAQREQTRLMMEQQAAASSATLQQMQQFMANQQQHVHAAIECDPAAISSIFEC